MCLSSAPALAESRAFVEIGETDERLNPAMLRRLVALELREIDVPESPRAVGEGPQEVTLHCRVLLDDGALRVEVWARGESAGTRRVSLQGTPALVARRVALAAAELARRLAHMRHAEARRVEREAREAEQLERAQALDRQRRRPALATRAHGVGFADGAYLVGPGVAAELNGDHPLRIELGARWGAGQLTLLPESPAWSVVELNVTPGWVIGLGEGTDLAVGVPLSVGIAHAGAALARTNGERDGWLLRSGLEVRFQPRLLSRLRLDAGLAGGVVLRGPLLQEGAPGTHRLGGTFGELSLGVHLD